MPTFDITDKKTGRKFTVTGPNKEGALAALKRKLDTEAASAAKDTPEMAARRRQGLDAAPPPFNPNVPGYNSQTGNVEHTSAGDKFGAFTGSVLEGVPVAGPALRSGAESVAAGLASATGGGDYGTLKRQATAATDQEIEDNPYTAMTGQVVGAVAPMVAGGATVAGGRLLGTTGSLLSRTLAGAGSNAVISGADTAARGGDLGDILKSAGIGGAVGGVLPAAGDLVGAAVGGARDFIKPRIGSIVNPVGEAESRVGAAYLADKANSADVPLLTAADEAGALRNGQPVLNVDRGGENMRALARSAANNDPSARDLFEKATGNRFETQGDRTRSLIDRLTGGAADDLAMQDAISSAAKKQNGPAYRKAYADGSDGLNSPELQRLMGSPAVVDAMKGAIKTGKDRAIKDGFGTFNPAISITDDGRIVFNKVKKAGGTTFPDLQFWDYTKRELDDMASTAARQGRNGAADVYGTLAKQLRGELDKLVPTYQQARAGAASFFGAEDALDAGKKFVTQNRNLDETARALSKMKPAERLSFAVGFASELKDLIKQSGDRTSVINKIFGSQQAREKIQLSLGKPAFHEFEQFVKVEDTMDKLRRAMGNSKTAQFIIESGLARTAGSGIAAGGGTWLFTGDWKKGIGAAAVAGLAHRYGMKIDTTMAKQMAKIMLADNPTALNRAAKMAAANPKAAKAVEDLQKLIGLAARGMADTQAAPNRSGQIPHEPLTISVGRSQAVDQSLAQ